MTDGAKKASEQTAPASLGRKKQSKAESSQKTRSEKKTENRKQNAGMGSNPFTRWPTGGGGGRSGTVGQCHSHTDGGGPLRTGGRRELGKKPKWGKLAK